MSILELSYDHIKYLVYDQNHTDLKHDYIRLYDRNTKFKAKVFVYKCATLNIEVDEIYRIANLIDPLFRVYKILINTLYDITFKYTHGYIDKQLWIPREYLNTIPSILEFVNKVLKENKNYKDITYTCLYKHDKLMRFYLNHVNNTYEKTDINLLDTEPLSDIEKELSDCILLYKDEYKIYPEITRDMYKDNNKLLNFGVQNLIRTINETYVDLKPNTKLLNDLVRFIIKTKSRGIEGLNGLLLMMQNIRDINKYHHSVSSAINVIEGVDYIFYMIANCINTHNSNLSKTFNLVLTIKQRSSKCVGKTLQKNIFNH